MNKRILTYLGRFWVDQRLGCVAIVDTLHPEYIASYEMNAYSPYVICFFEWKNTSNHGLRNLTSSFNEKQEDIDKCYALCEYLNENFVKGYKKMQQKLNKVVSA